MEPFHTIAAILQLACMSAIPLAMAGVGELLAQRAGILNVGIEGTMLCGCISAFAVASTTGSPWLGLGAAILTGLVIAAAFGLSTIYARVDQIVAGMAINIFALGFSGTWWAYLQQTNNSYLPTESGFLPIGSGYLQHYPLLWFAVAALIAVRYTLRSTRAGLIIAALGDAPDAAATTGIPVRKARLILVLIAGVCAGIAGAYLSTMRTHSFVPGMTGGQGFLVLALVIFGRWTAGGLALGCMLFGLINALQQHCQSAGWTAYVPYQVFQALPYLSAVIALAIWAKKAPGPTAMNQPWPKVR